jgi:histone H3
MDAPASPAPSPPAAAPTKKQLKTKNPDGAAPKDLAAFKPGGGKTAAHSTKGKRPKQVSRKALASAGGRQGKQQASAGGASTGGKKPSTYYNTKPKNSARQQNAKALKEIKKAQKSTELLIRNAPFKRLVREIVQEASNGNDLRMQPGAFIALKEGVEAYIVTFLTKCAGHAYANGRVTVMLKDARFIDWLSKLDATGGSAQFLKPYELKHA